MARALLTAPVPCGKAPADPAAPELDRAEVLVTNPEILKKTAQESDGSYRVVASKGLPGKDIGPFKYFGTRPDDQMTYVTSARSARTCRARYALGWKNRPRPEEEKKSFGELELELIRTGWGRAIIGLR